MLKSTGKPVTLILAASEIGAGKRGAGKGPLALKEAITKQGIQFDHISEVLMPHQQQPEEDHKFAKQIDQLADNMQALNDTVEKAIADNTFPLLFSGDHSNAIGGLSGLKNAMPDKRIGVIWIDAHADLHSPYTTPSGNLHGMPLAALAGLDHPEIAKNPVSTEEKAAWERLKLLGRQQLTPKYNTSDLVFIDIRDAEDEEWEVIRKRGIKHFTPDDVHAKGMAQVLSETLAYLDACDVFYVSFDVDSLDISVSVGTGTPVPDGLSTDEGRMVFETLLMHPKTALFEITEINPDLDQDGKHMADVVAALLHNSIRYNSN